MRTNSDEHLGEAAQLYERYGKPLEGEHRGEYLAVSPEGKTLLGPTLLDVVRKASTTFGPGNLVFKVGDRTVGEWR